MPDNSVSNKRIARNTVILYFRMLLLMVVGLFTSRVVLQVLGVEDYGIYSVIAGFLSMFGIVTGSMSTSISRFITVMIGKGETDKLKDIFATSIVIQFFMGLIMVVLLESFGIWFLNNKLNIPNGRESAATWCLHCSALVSFITLLSIPFNSAIIAHEKMSAFAYMSIFDALFKLIVCFGIYISPIDRLVTYAFLMVLSSIITACAYCIYCRMNFSECRANLNFDKEILKEMWGFAGWNFLGNSAFILNTQGVNMLMNIFFGVTINAARGIAVQVNGIVQQFVNNFMTALNPQITKLYSSGDKDNAFKLSCRGARFSFYIMYILALPLMVESQQILELWLGTPPKESNIFMIWTIIGSLTLLIGNTLVTLQMAHGNIRHYQIWITFFGGLPFPLSWLAFKIGAPAVSGFIIYAAVYWGLIFVRYYLVKGMTGIPAKMYLVDVVLKCHIIALLAAIAPIVIISNFPPTFLRLCLSVMVCLSSSFFVIYVFGLEGTEKELIKEKWCTLKKILLK